MSLDPARARTIGPLGSRAVVLNPRDTSAKRQIFKVEKRAPSRLEALDLARGIAIALMILSHGVKGLLAFEDFPYWGLVPIHLITKFSSSLFILVFGVSLAVSVLPAVNTPQWGEKRRKLLIRGLTVLFWYKVLTIVEMFHLYKREDIIKALLYESFPVYVEILGFYGLALLWLPFALSLWKRMPVYLRLLVPVGFLWLTHWLGTRPDLFSSPQLQALLIEHDSYYTWGQISRAPLIFAGLLLGQWIVYERSVRGWSLNLPLFLKGTAGVLFAAFCLHSWPSLSDAFMAAALNKGKHPPELSFMLFSLSGAVLILGCALSGGAKWARRLAPLSLLGRDALGAFVFHAFVLFVFYRFLFDLWLKVTYGRALALAVLLIGLSALWVKTREWVRKA